MSDHASPPGPEIVVRLAQRFVFFARNGGVPMQDCQDVAQDTVAAILAQLNIGRFRSESSFETWAIAIFRNKVADYWRRHKRVLSEISGQDADKDGSARSIEAAQEDASIITEALRRLPPKHRAAFVLNKIEGFTGREISQMTGVPAGTINRLVSEAIVKLRDIMSSEEIRDPKRLLGSENAETE